ncbi:hypothetical protein PAEPH01_2854, partial [Pancytospora epiphaga]
FSGDISMAKDRNQKYKQNFHTMIKRIIDAESHSDEWSDESLDERIQVASSDGSVDLQDEIADDDSTETTVSLHSLQGENTQSGISEANQHFSRPNPGSTLRESEFCEINDKEIINPLSKLRRKKQTKRCLNFEE